MSETQKPRGLSYSNYFEDDLDDYDYDDGDDECQCNVTGCPECAFTVIAIEAFTIVAIEGTQG